MRNQDFCEDDFLEIMRKQRIEIKDMNEIHSSGKIYSCKDFVQGETYLFSVRKEGFYKKMKIESRIVLGIRDETFDNTGIEGHSRLGVRVIKPKRTYSQMGSYVLKSIDRVFHVEEYKLLDT